MATKTINQKITLSGGEEIVRSLRDLARLGEETFKRLADAASKIDINLPVDKVKEQLQQFAQQGQQAFVQLGQAGQQAFEQIGQSAQQASTQVSEVGAAAQKTAQDVSSIGAASQSMGEVAQQANAASTGISNIGTAVKVVAGTITGLAATFSALAIAAAAMGKSASDSVIAIGRSADAAGVSISNFSRANTLLQQFGLTSDQSASAIKRLGEAGKTAFDVAVTAMQRLQDTSTSTLTQMDQALARVGEEGTRQLTAMERALQGTQKTLMQAAIEGGKASETIARQSGVIINKVALENEQVRAKFMQQMAAMADITINGKRIFDEGTAAILKYAAAFNEVTGAARRPTEMLTELGDRLQRIPDAAERARVLTLIFGKELATVLAPAVERGTAAFVNMIATIDRLRLGVTDAEKKVGQDFRAAWDLLQAVIKRNSDEIGILIAKPLTPFIIKFAEAMRTSSDTFKLFEAAVQGITPLLDKLLASMSGVSQIDAGFLERVKQGVQQFGEAVVAVFSNVVVPAFNSLIAIATETASVLTTLFGSQVTPTMVALGAIFTALLGPVKALGVALLALFGGQGSGFDKFRENLAKFGVDIDGIRQRFKQSFAQEMPNVINILIQSLNGLLAVLRGLTGVINTVFGTQFSSAAVAAAVAVGILTGAFQALSPIFVIVAASLSALVSTLNLFALALTGIAALIGWPATLAISIALLVTNFESLSNVLGVVARALNALTGLNIFTGEGLSVALIAALTAAFIRLAFGIGLVQTALIALANTPAIAALLTLAAIIQDLNRAADPTQKKLEEINKEFARTGDLEAYNRAMKEFDDTQRRVGSGAGIDVGSMWQRMKAEADKAIQGIVSTSQQGANAVTNQWKDGAQRMAGGFREVGPGLWVPITESGKQAVEKIVLSNFEAAQKIAAGYRQIAPGVFERIATEAQQAATNIEKPITQALTTIKREVEQTRNVVAEGFRDLQTGPAVAQADALRDGLNRMADAARTAKLQLDELESGTKQGSGEGKQDPSSLFEKMFRLIDEAGQRFNRIPKDVATAILPAIQAIFDGIESIFSTSIAKAEEKVPEVVRPFETAAEQVGNVFSAVDPFQPLVEKAQNAVNSIVQALAQIPRALAGIGLLAPFQAALQGITPIIDGIRGAIDSLAPSLQTATTQAQALMAAFGSGTGAPATSGATSGETSAEQGGGQAAGGPFGAILASMQQALAQMQAMVAAASPVIAAQFQALAAQIAAALSQAGTTDPFAPMVQSAQNAAAAIGQVFAALAQLILQPFFNVQSGAAQIMAGVEQVVSAGFQSMISTIASVAASVDAAIQQIIASLQAAVAEAERLAAAAADAAAAASRAGGGSGFARGGYTGDIGIRRVAGVVHGGEYVEPAHVVRKPGVRAFLETLRRVGDLREALRRFSRGFSVGGFVDDLGSRMAGALMPLPGFANGGLVPVPAAGGGARRDLGVLRLDAGGEMLEVLTDDATAFKLQRFARRQLMTSGGRAPVWER
jgi:hypothetical protein